MRQLQTSRRNFLRAAGVGVALPLLHSTVASAAETAAPPKRLVAMNFALGLHGPNFFPEKSGANYDPTPYLEALGVNNRSRLTIVSGTSHPDVTIGHASDASFLTAARFPGRASFRNSISLDQFAAENLRPDTRFASLALGTRNGSMSFSRSGVLIPGESQPSRLFAKMFITGTKSQMAAQIRRLEDGHSVLDAVLGPAKQLQARVSPPDRERLDQYFSAVRELEQRLAGNQVWTLKPKPHVDYSPPKDVADPNDDLRRLELMLDLIHLALQTDSTRLVTLYISGSNTVQPVPGVSQEYHGLSHHGQDPDKLAQLKIIQTRQMTAVGQLLGKLQKTPERDGTLLNNTAVLFGASMGNASNHNCQNLPIVLAGGGFRHGRHLAFDPRDNAPLCRLYVSLLQWMGIETDRFGSGVGTLTGLELV